AEAEPALAKGVERPPQQPVEKRHQHAHYGDAEDHAWKVTGFRRPCYIGAEPSCRQMDVAPACDLGNDRGIPGTARGGDRAGDVIRKDAGQDDLDPPPPSLEMKAARGLA